MSPDEIRERVVRLDTRDVAASDAAWSELRPLREAVVPYLLEAYLRARRAELRVALVFHAIRHARRSEDAFALGIAAVSDRSSLVRYRACGLLAYSLRRDAIPHLTKLIAHPDERSAEDARAALDAIEHANHHFFIDRDHSGRTRWVVEPGDSPA